MEDADLEKLEMLESLRSGKSRHPALEMIRQKYGLSSLYYIKTYPSSIFFGARPVEQLALNRADIQQELTAIITEMDVTKINGEIASVVLGADPEEEVSLLLSELNPYVASHGGAITVVSLDEKSGKVVLSLQGSCSGCPSSMITLKRGVEVLLKQYLPWVQSVESDSPPMEPDFGFSLDDKEDDE